MNWHISPNVLPANNEYVRPVFVYTDSGVGEA